MICQIMSEFIVVSDDVLICARPSRGGTRCAGRDCPTKQGKEMAMQKTAEEVLKELLGLEDVIFTPSGELDKNREQEGPDGDPPKEQSTPSGQPERGARGH
jgi:hypothetical protein